MISSINTRQKPRGRLTTAPGFVALITVLIVMALGVLLAVGLSLRSVDSGNTLVADLDGVRAHYAASYCAEYALDRLKNSSSYVGNAMRILDNGDTCFIFAPGGSGNSNRTVRATSTVNGATKKIDIYINTIGPTMLISKWQEVADF